LRGEVQKHYEKYGKEKMCAFEICSKPAFTRKKEENDFFNKYFPQHFEFFRSFEDKLPLII
jgi:hypothetical protein